LPATHDTDRARSYFDALAPEYNRAFELTGRSPFSAFVNRFFRGRTFAHRMQLLEALFARIGMGGRRVLDLGCGSGQVSLLAASMGASVQGIDIAPQMLRIARESSQRAGVHDRVSFSEGDIAVCPLPEADVVLVVGVIEYYRDYAAIVTRAAAAASKYLVVAHTSRIFYRMWIRRVMFALSRANVYFHPMRDIIQVAEREGLKLTEERREHAFTIAVFERRG
jgi:2-polyprenyl-3-methyl-5-hydroxy-6-metoxy-1,4-benzoquinol methylase